MDGFGYANFLGLSSPVWMLLVLFLFWWWFRGTRLGITIQATGSNEKSAFLSGVSITRVNVMTYGLSGLFAAGAALYLTTQTGAGSPTIGKDYILPSVAAAVIGGVSLFGGRGHLAGTLIGAFILTLIGNLVFVLKCRATGSRSFPASSCCSRCWQVRSPKRPRRSVS